MRTFIFTVASFTGSSVKICARAATVGVDVECGCAVEHAVASARPCRSDYGLEWGAIVAAANLVSGTLGPYSLL
jgi:hypothetical protein